eukprot:TRINITY_DN39320_c0_g1_i1.p1 TRINITY_DN39320_c0_g1~~TRINITY_DN39320_c0_g1_i1.p1  ORF type:complete len:1718 (+),score=418.84 TRINITY_DN39320_c0_g1_i1:61-5154(+)
MSDARKQRASLLMMASPPRKRVPRPPQAPPAVPMRLRPAARARPRRVMDDSDSDDNDDSEAESEEESSSDESEPAKTNPVDKILSCRMKDGEREFLIKLADRPYRECAWMKEGEVHRAFANVRGRCMKLVAYMQRKPVCDETIGEGSHFDEQFLQLERVVSVKRVQGVEHVLVKWYGLGYDECTWELGAAIREESPAEYEACMKRREVPLSVGQLRQGLVTDSVLHSYTKLVDGMEFKNGHALRDYQRAGVTWLGLNWLRARSCILGDEMGLGKTIQVLSFFQSLISFQGFMRPFLVIAPLATIPHWCREAVGWTDMNVVSLLGNMPARNAMASMEFTLPGSRQPMFDVLVTSYEIAMMEQERLSKFRWRCIVVDEGHRLKSESSRLYTQMSSMKADHRVVLTGTPVQNRLGELYALLKYLDPRIVATDVTKFLAQFEPLDAVRLQTLFNVLRPRLLRREKHDVEKDIPPKVETLIKVKLTRVQREAYRCVLEKNGDALQNKNLAKLKFICMYLRHVCNHPWLIAGVMEKQLAERGETFESASPSLVHEAHLSASGKLQCLDKLLTKFRKEGERVLIFTQFVMVLKEIEHLLKWREWPHEALHGAVAAGDRQRSIDRFQDLSQDCFVFMITTKAGGCGINLTAATKVIIYDSDWNPQNDIQAQARCHRIGQTRRVDVYRMLSEDCYEERMFDVASKKLGLDSVVLRGASGGEADPDRMTADEIQRLLRHGAYSMFKDNGEEDDAAEEDIEAVLARSKQVDVSGGPQQVRGLSGFAEARFGAAVPDDEAPDFWDKVLPTKLTAATITGLLLKQQELQESECMRIVSALRGIYEDIMERDEHTWWQPAGIRRKDELQQALRLACSIPALKEYTAETSAMLASLSVERTRKSSAAASVLGDDKAESKRANVGPQAALSQWTWAAAYKLISRIRQHGFTSWERIWLKLVAEGKYPVTDGLTEEQRTAQFVARAEAFLTSVVERAEAEAASAPKQRGKSSDSDDGFGWPVHVKAATVADSAARQLDALATHQVVAGAAKIVRMGMRVSGRERAVAVYAAKVGSTLEFSQPMANATLLTGVSFVRVTATEAAGGTVCCVWGRGNDTIGKEAVIRRVVVLESGGSEDITLPGASDDYFFAARALEPDSSPSVGSVFADLQQVAGDQGSTCLLVTMTKPASIPDADLPPAVEAVRDSKVARLMATLSTVAVATGGGFLKGPAFDRLRVSCPADRVSTKDTVARVLAELSEGGVDALHKMPLPYARQRVREELLMPTLLETLAALGITIRLLPTESALLAKRRALSARGKGLSDPKKRRLLDRIARDGIVWTDAGDVNVQALLDGDQGIDAEGAKLLVGQLLGDGEPDERMQQKWAKAREVAVLLKGLQDRVMPIVEQARDKDAHRDAHLARLFEAVRASTPKELRPPQKWGSACDYSLLVCVRKYGMNWKKIWSDDMFDKMGDSAGKKGSSRVPFPKSDMVLTERLGLLLKVVRGDISVKCDKEISPEMHRGPDEGEKTAGRSRKQRDSDTAPNAKRRRVMPPPGNASITAMFGEPTLAEQLGTLHRGRKRTHKRKEAAVIIDDDGSSDGASPPPRKIPRGTDLSEETDPSSPDAVSVAQKTPANPAERFRTLSSVERKKLLWELIREAQADLNKFRGDNASSFQEFIGKVSSWLKAKDDPSAERCISAAGRLQRMRKEIAASGK